MNEHLEQHHPAGRPTPPPNYMVWAILTTIFCCLPFGIVSIVFAAQVNSKWYMGDLAGAELSSKNARLWAWISFGVGIGGIIIWFMLLFFGIAAGGIMETFEGLNA